MLQNLSKESTSGKYIVPIDASLIKESSCLYRLILMGICGYTGKLQYNDVQYGSAFHLFQSELFRTKNFAQAQLAAVEMNQRPCLQRTNRNHLTDAHLVKTCIDFMQWSQKHDQYEVMHVDGVPLVEQQFSIRYMETEHFVVYLQGTIDSLGKINNGVYAIRDYKTKSLWRNRSASGSLSPIDQEIKEYLEQYGLSSQLRFYLYCIRWLGTHNQDTTLGKIFAQHQFGLFIQGIFTHSKEPSIYKKSDVFMLTDDDIAEYAKTLDKQIGRLVSILEHYVATGEEYHIRDGILIGSCFEGKFPCKFRGACMAPQLELRKMVLEQQFIHRTYNPLSHGK